MSLLFSNINRYFLASLPDIILGHHFILSTRKLHKLTEGLNKMNIYILGDRAVIVYPLFENFESHVVLTIEIFNLSC